MSATGITSALAPSYIEPSNIHTWLTDIFNSPHGLPCICGDQTVGEEVYPVRPYIIDICQRTDEPCKVDVKFHLGSAEGIYYFQPNQSGFSLDTTNGRNGTWHQLRTDKTDAGHNPSLNNPTLMGSDSVDTSWNYSSYDPNNPNHTSTGECLVNWENLGVPVHNFVFDMCEHISSWFSETGVCFRLTFDKVEPATFDRLSCGVQTI